MTNNKYFLVFLASLTVVGLVLGLGKLPGALAADPLQDISGEGAPPRTISVNGSGRVRMDPDIARINIGVHTENQDAQEAVAENNASVEEIMAALESFGIAAEDIRTSNFSIYPRQEYDRDGNLTGIIYVVDNSVQVTLRNLDSIGSLLNAAVEAGANSINGIQFTVEDPDEAYDAALEAAVQNARSRAETLAEAAGVQLGEVQTISAHIGGGPVPIYQDMRFDVAAAEASVPISPGQTELTVDVNVVYTIE